MKRILSIDLSSTIIELYGILMFNTTEVSLLYFTLNSFIIAQMHTRIRGMKTSKSENSI